MADVKHILVKIGADTKDLDKGMDKTEKRMQAFGAGIKKIGGFIASAFAVERIINFSHKSVILAANAEGIRVAFNKLNQPGLLDNLRAATRGTVTDVKLMQQAIRAQNFQVPLEKLATFFEFATKRAIETGESVDYLVQSIIDGIGRKSTLVLDNLGISASQLQEEIKKTGDFGQAAANIINEGLRETGDVADTTATKIAQIKTAFENAKEGLGNFILGKTELDRTLWTWNEWLEKNLFYWFFYYANTEAQRFNMTLEHIRENMEDIDYSRTTELLQRKVPEYGMDINNLFGDMSLRDKPFQRSGLWAMTYAISEMEKEATSALPKIKQVVDSLGESVINFPPFDPLIKDPNWHDQLVQKREDYLHLLNILRQFHDEDEELIEGFTKAEQSIAQVAQSIAGMGYEIGRALGGAEDSFESLAQTIAQNIGNLMMMFGAQTGNLPLFLAGAAFQLGSGIFGGFSSANQRTTAGYSSGVSFYMSGDNLVGVEQRHNQFKNVVT